MSDINKGRTTETANRYAGGEWRGPILMQAFRLVDREQGASVRSAHIFVRVGGDVEHVRTALEDRVMESTRETDWHVVVPVKGGRTAKSRLRRQIDDEALVAAIIHDTLDVVARVVTPARLLVVTSDPDESAHARALGAMVVADPGHGLNEACLAGVRAVRARHSGDVVPVAVLLGDHPALTDHELSAVLDEGSGHTTFFVADADGEGTALVGSTVPGEPDLAFGPASAARHSSLGHVPLDIAVPGLRHDVDDEVALRHAAAHLTLGPRTLSALGR